MINQLTYDECEFILDALDMYESNIHPADVLEGGPMGGQIVMPGEDPEEFRQKIESQRSQQKQKMEEERLERRRKSTRIKNKVLDRQDAIIKPSTTHERDAVPYVDPEESQGGGDSHA